MPPSSLRMALLAIKRRVESRVDLLPREPLRSWGVNWALAFARLKMQQLFFGFGAMLLFSETVSAILFRSNPHWRKCAIEFSSTELVNKVEGMLSCLVAVKPIDYSQGP